MQTKERMVVKVSWLAHRQMLKS